MADIKEQDLALKTTIADTDWIRLVNQTGNHRITVGQFKDLIGYTALQQRTQDLEDEFNTHLAEDVNQGNPHGIDAKASKGSGQWVAIPATGGFTGNVVYRKSDTNLVNIEVSNVKHDAMAPLLTIATLPVGYRPVYEIAFNVVAPTTGHVAQLYINASGLIRTPQNNTLQSGVEYQGVVTYVRN